MTSPKTTLRDMILGLLFFTLLLGLVYVTTQLRNWPGSGTRNYMVVLFEDVSGAKKEDRVLVYGTTYGRIAKVEPVTPAAWRDAKVDVVQQYGSRAAATFEPHVLVTIELDYPIEMHTDYEIAAEDANVLGGKVISINPGKPDAATTMAPEPDTVHNLDPAKADDLKVVRFIGIRRPNPILAIGEVVNENREKFKKIVDGLAELAANVNDKTKGIGYLLADTDSRTTIKSVFDNIEKFSKSINNTESLAHDLLADNSNLRKRANSIVENVDNAFKDPKTVIGSLTTADSDLKKNIDGIVSDTKEATSKLNDPNSAIGRALASGKDSWGEKLDSVLTNVRDAFDQSKTNKDSIVYELFYSDAGKRLDELVTAARTEIFDPIRDAKGVLGWLINDPDAKKKADRLVSATLGIIEDAREAAPVTSLGSFIFGGF